MQLPTNVRLEYLDRATGEWREERGSSLDSFDSRKLFPNEAHALARGDELRQEGKTDEFRILTEDRRELSRWRRRPGRADRQFERVS